MHLPITTELHTHGYLKDQNHAEYSIIATLPVTIIMDATLYC
jgi:hypothetical protein